MQSGSVVKGDVLQSGQRCIIHYDSECLSLSLVSPITVESCQNLLKDAEIRQHSELLNIASRTEQGTVPTKV